jgi:hypothetical protein
MKDEREPEAGVLDGETVEEMHIVDDEAEPPYATPPRDPSKDRAIIAWMLIGIMAGGLLFHYVAVIAFEWNGKHEAVKSLEPILNAWLPVVSGLAGAAVTYYFTRERR